MLLLHGLPLVAVFRNIACTCRFAAAMAVNEAEEQADECNLSAMLGPDADEHPGEPWGVRITSQKPWLHPKPGFTSQGVSGPFTTNSIAAFR